MGSEDGHLDFEKPRRAALGGKTKAASVSPKEILSIMSGRFNEESADGDVVKKKIVKDKPAVIPTHKMEMCMVCGKIGPRIRFLTMQRNVCSRACEAERDQTTATPIPWINLEADLTVVSKRELRQPERSLRRRGATGSFRWQDAAMAGKDLHAAPVDCFPHAPALALWRRVTIACSSLPPRLVVESELPPGDAPATALWIARVTALRGYMACLRYEGVYDPAKDFWVNLAAQTYPLGWAAANGRPLVPPRAAAKARDDEGWRTFFSVRLRGCQTLPWDFVQQLAEGRQARFKRGMRMELVDKDQITRVRLARVETVAACRLHMRYVDAGADDPGFVCHQDSPLIHPVGWAHHVGAMVLAPTDYLLRCEENSFLPEDALPELFLSPGPVSSDPRQRIVAGMKLEAIDPLNLSAICAGTVAKVLRDGYLMVRIESYDEEEDGSRADWFCYHATSPSIFPVGFCQRNGLRLVPPKGFPGAVFSWERYLKQTGARPAPLPPHEPLAHGFVPGHRLEAADLMDPRKVCAASVAQVVGRLLRVHFDGWGSEYDQWMDAKSPDIYPAGWCEMVGHRLEPPCGTVVPPRGVGVVVNMSRLKSPPSDSDSDSDSCPVLTPVPPAKPSPGNKNPPRLRAATSRLRQGEVKTEAKASPVKTEPISEESDASIEESEASQAESETSPAKPQGKSSARASADSTQELRAPRRIVRPPARFLRSSLPAQGSAGHFQQALPRRTRSANRCGKKLGRAAKLREKEPSKVAKPREKELTKPGLREDAQFGSSDEDKPLLMRLGQKQVAARAGSPGRKRTSGPGPDKPAAKVTAPVLAAMVGTATVNVREMSEDRTEAGLHLPGSIDSDPKRWTRKDVSAFLEANDCGTFAGAFLSKNIDGPTFLSMTDTNIILLTSTKVGPALLIADLIHRLKTLCQQRDRVGSP